MSFTVPPLCHACGRPLPEDGKSLAGQVEAAAPSGELESSAATAGERPPLSALIGKNLTASQRAALVVAMYWQPKPKKRRRHPPQPLRRSEP
jgi:hypothetical protein